MISTRPVGGTDSRDFPTTPGACDRTFHTGGKQIGPAGIREAWIDYHGVVDAALRDAVILAAFVQPDCVGADVADLTSLDS